jgi:hypothetical protein
MLLSSSVRAETIRLDFVLPFRNLVPYPNQFSTGLDCERTARFNVGDAGYLKRDLINHLSPAGILFVDRGEKYGLRLYITHDDCGVSGEKNNKSYPLGLGQLENDYAGAYLRILAEIQDRNTGELISMREYIAIARLERNISQGIFISIRSEVKQASKRDLWNSIVTELSKGIVQDVRP